jgi:hypothetical protein
MIRKFPKILLLALFLLGFSACHTSQVRQQDTLNTFLANNKEEFVCDNPEFNILKEELDKNELFLTGEIHGAKENYSLRFTFLKYLKEQADIKYYLAEMGYSSSHFLNKYFETGDRKYLDMVAYSCKGGYDFSVEDYEFWKNFSNYNKSLDKEERIKVVGIDLEHQYWLAVLHLNDITKNKKYSGLIKERMDKIQYFANLINPDNSDPKKIMERVESFPNKEFFGFVKGIVKEINTKEKEYRKVLGEKDFEEFAFIVNGMDETFRAYSDQETFYVEREKNIYKNFKTLYTLLPKGKYFGQWGSFHIYQKKTNDETNLGTYINQDDSPVKDKVLSINYVYDSNDPRFSLDKNVENLKILRGVKENDKFTLFKVESEEQENLLANFKSNIYKDSIGDYFQYAILIKNPEKVKNLN